MLAVLGKILGSGDVVKQGMKLIDDMHTSTEEEIAAKSKARIDLMNAYAPFKLAQRYLALMFGFTFLASYIIVLTMTIVGKGDPKCRNAGDGTIQHQLRDDDYLRLLLWCRGAGKFPE